MKNALYLLVNGQHGQYAPQTFAEICEDKPAAEINKPYGVYDSLEAFQADAGLLGNVAGLAASLAGIGRSWETHGKTLEKILEALRPASSRIWQLDIEFKNPAIARAYRNVFLDVFHIIQDVEKLDRENKGMNLLKKVRGPWALDLLSRVEQAQGRYSVDERTLMYLIKDSTPYAKIARPTPKDKDNTKDKAHRSGWIHYENGKIYK